MPEVEMDVFYLEMTAPPKRGGIRPEPEGFALVRVAQPIPIHYYRYLYETVGDRWWFERTLLTDTELSKAVHHPAVELYVPHLHGAPAGMVELDFSCLPDVELVMFGVMPEHIGKGFGGFLLDWAVTAAFARGAGRLWLHTCSFDHPSALPVYQRAGFRHYQTVTERVTQPAGGTGACAGPCPGKEV